MLDNETRDRARIINLWWDHQDGCPNGWYAEALDVEEVCIVDSEKSWFPVNLDDFGADEGNAMAGELQEAFPRATVFVSDGDGGFREV